jgi:four helix bundle protein
MEGGNYGKGDEWSRGDRGQDAEDRMQGTGCTMHDARWQVAGGRFLEGKRFIQVYWVAWPGAKWWNPKMAGYRNLEVYQLARELAVAIHLMTLRDLPKFELYEAGSQIRRSSKSIRSNLVEGFGRRRHKGDFLRFLYYAQASHDETLDHLESLWETGSLTHEENYRDLHQKAEILGRKLNRFIQSVEEKHRS